MPKVLVKERNYNWAFVTQIVMHIPVLLKEVVETLNPQAGDTVLDCTINDAGHSLALAGKIGKRGKLIGLDEDRNALERARERLANSGPEVILRESNFRNLDEVLKEAGIDGADRILFDLGLSSEQLEASGRGFSFKGDEPLLMTYGAVPKSGQLTAFEIVNSWRKEELAKILSEYGEERFSRRIAEGIVGARKKGFIRTTADLREIVVSSVPSFYRNRKIDPATKTFQAIRLAVNDEPGALKEGLVKAAAALKKGGRLAAISFHSLEDRIVKNYFRELSRGGAFHLINKKVIVPGREEVRDNPRARSAKLRVIEKIS